MVEWWRSTCRWASTVSLRSCRPSIGNMEYPCYRKCCSSRAVRRSIRAVVCAAIRQAPIRIPSSCSVATRSSGIRRRHGRTLRMVSWELFFFSRRLPRIFRCLWSETNSEFMFYAQTPIWSQKSINVSSCLPSIRLWFYALNSHNRFTIWARRSWVFVISLFTSNTCNIKAGWLWWVCLAAFRLCRAKFNSLTHTFSLSL